MDGNSFLSLLGRNRNAKDKWPDTFLIESSGRRETPEQIAENRARAAAKKYSDAMNALNVTDDGDLELNGTTSSGDRRMGAIDLSSVEHDEDDDLDDGKNCFKICEFLNGEN